MPSEPDWLTVAEVIELHAAVVEMTGEPAGLRDLGLLESAVARARNVWTYDESSDVVDLACLLMLAIARNHPFIQGNKRAGFVAGQAFLEYNGYNLRVPDSVDFANSLIRTIADPSLDHTFTSLLRQHIEPLP